MAKNKTVDNIVTGFLEYLDKNESRHLLPEIVSRLQKGVISNIQQAIVYSAFPLNKTQEKTLESEILNKYLVKEVKFEVDKELLGGFKIVVGDQVEDLSTKAKLEYFSQNV